MRIKKVGRREMRKKELLIAHHRQNKCIFIYLSLCFFPFSFFLSPSLSLSLSHKEIYIYILTPSPNRIIYTSANLPQPPFILITTFNIALAYCLAVIIPDISSVFGLVGATSGCMIAFIFPCACFLKLER